jgi:hypothetical protein
VCRSIYEPLLEPLLDEPSPPRETEELPESDEPADDFPPDTVFPDDVVTRVVSLGTVVVPPLARCPMVPEPP